MCKGILTGSHLGAIVKTILGTKLAGTCSSFWGIGMGFDEDLLWNSRQVLDTYLEPLRLERCVEVQGSGRSSHGNGRLWEVLAFSRFEAGVAYYAYSIGIFPTYSCGMHGRFGLILEVCLLFPTALGRGMHQLCLLKFCLWAWR